MLVLHTQISKTTQAFVDLTAELWRWQYNDPLCQKSRRKKRI